MAVTVVVVVTMVGGLWYCHAAPSGSPRPSAPSAARSGGEEQHPFCRKVALACPDAPRGACTVAPATEPAYPELGATAEVRIEDARWYVAEDGTVLTFNGPSMMACPDLPNAPDEARARAGKVAAEACTAEELAIGRDVYAAMERSPEKGNKIYRAVAKKRGVKTKVVTDAWDKVAEHCVEAL